jgi:DNA-binding response OmpR family regulator
MMATTASEKRLLVIEDDPHIAEGLELNLTLQGYQVRVATDGNEGLQLWRDWHPQLIVLDLMLPGMDGLSVLQNIRLTDKRLPVLILSARGEAADRIKGFTHGVDDYLAKPFNLEEFLLRVKRLLERDEWQRQSPAPTADVSPDIGPAYVFGPNRIDFTTATATCRGGTVRLTEQEVKLLKLFIAHRGKPLSRRRLQEIGWGYARNVTTRTVDNFIVRFRRYFEANPKNPVYFKSRRGLGYVFEDQEPC